MSAKDLLTQSPFSRWLCRVCWSMHAIPAWRKWSWKDWEKPASAAASAIAWVQGDIWSPMTYRLVTYETLSWKTRQNKTRCPSFMTLVSEACQPGNGCRIREELGLSLEEILLWSRHQGLSNPVLNLLGVLCRSRTGKKWRKDKTKQGIKCYYVGIIKHYCEQAILVTSVAGLSGLGLPIEKSLIWSGDDMIEQEVI